MVFLIPAIGPADILPYAARLMTVAVFPAAADLRMTSPHYTGTLRPRVPDDRPSAAGQGTRHRARPNDQRPVKRTGLWSFGGAAPTQISGTSPTDRDSRMDI